MDLNLCGRHVLVTGASRGIGAATARRFAGEDCKITLVARSRVELEQLAASIQADTGHCPTILVADLSLSQDVAAVAHSCGPVDILVNNAGAIPGGRLDDVSETVWRHAWDLKVFGYINLCRWLFTDMKRRGTGTIVNVIGIAARTRDPTYICGVAANAALEAFTMALGSDSHQYGVRVVGISPGPVATERLNMLVGSVQASRDRPFGRAATPEEVADAIMFVASPRSAYTSGAIISIDGGISARTGQ